MSDKKAFQVGDKVTCILWGKGVVEKVDDSLNFPVKVRFADGDSVSYTLDGKAFKSHIRPTLYHGHGTFNIELIEEKEPEFKYQWLIKTVSGSILVTDKFYTREAVEAEYTWQGVEIIKPIEETKIEK